MRTDNLSSFDFILCIRNWFYFPILVITRLETETGEVENEVIHFIETTR
jgi:hypothetical protein